MTEYIEREAVLALQRRLYHSPLSNVIELSPTYIISPDAVQRIPAADVVPVVRCKDCRKGIPDSEHATAYSCYGIWHKPDWFCAGGVRKDGDGDV